MPSSRKSGTRTPRRSHRLSLATPPPPKRPRRSTAFFAGDDSVKRGRKASLAYYPVHFLRAHSMKGDTADIHTQVWDVAFEPDPYDPDRTTSLVATCGGHVICVIDVNTGKVKLKYRHKDQREMFYTLAWSTLEQGTVKSNILAAGGSRGEVRMFYTEDKACYGSFRPADKCGVAVNSLVFHSERPTWLFCGTSDGYVSLWDIGAPKPPHYDQASPRLLLKLFPDRGDVYNIVWTGDNRWLLAGADAGLVGWNIEDDNVLGKPNEYKPQMVSFLLPESDRDDGRRPVVDAVAVTSKWTIAAKCALHGLVYIWDLKSCFNEENRRKSSRTRAGSKAIEQNVKMLAQLKWSDTENFYLNLGCHKGSGLICCGDDKGTLWLYNQPQLGKDCSPPTRDTIEPTTQLPWPELKDDHLENARKAPLDKRDEIIVNKAVASHDNAHVVAVTANNMVCIWKRISNNE